MFLQGSKIKTLEAAVNQQMKFSTRQLSQEFKSSHSLHRRNSTVGVINQDAYKIEDKYSKQLNQLLHTKYYNMHQLFKKKQYIPANFKLNNKPFEHVLSNYQSITIVTNQFSKTSSQLVQKKKKFNAKEWHKVNYDRFRFLSRQASIEKLVTNRQQSIQPCLQIQQANRQQRSVSQMNNYRTESINSLNNERCKCHRSNSLQKENLVIFLIEENQQNQKHDGIAQIV